jgi:hypothetical protein
VAAAGCAPRQVGRKQSICGKAFPLFGLAAFPWFAQGERALNFTGYESCSCMPRMATVRTKFTCELVTIWSKKSFAGVTAEIEALLQRYDLAELARLTALGDTAKLEAFVRKTGEPTEFAIFFQLDQGSTQRLAGIPIESRFYLFGNATIAQGLFRYSATAGLGAPVRFCVSQQDGADTRIDIDLPSAFFSQFPDLRESKVPAELDARMIALLEKIAG